MASIPKILGLPDGWNFPVWQRNEVRRCNSNGYPGRRVSKREADSGTRSQVDEVQGYGLRARSDN